MRYLLSVMLCLFFAGCTISHSVKDVQYMKEGHLLIEKCNLTAYPGLFGLIWVPIENCHLEVVQQQHK